MRSRTLRAFAVLANGERTESTFEGNQQMSALMAKAAEQEKKDAEKAIVSELTGIVSSVQNALEGFDADVRSFEAAIREAKADRDALVEAQAYGNSTGNYLPLLLAIGEVDLDDYAEAGFTAAEWEGLCTIPEPDEDPEV